MRCRVLVPTVQVLLVCIALAASAGLPTDGETWYQLACDQDFRDPKQHNVEKAIKSYEKAASLGHSHAKGVLSLVYWSAEADLPFQKEKAIEFARDGIEGACPFGHYTLGVAYQQGKGGISIDEAKADFHYRAATEGLTILADRNNPRAQRLLGVMHSMGVGGLTKDDKAALGFYRRSANLNYALGQFNLARMYENGRGGLNKDLIKAEQLYLKAAKQGYSSAKHDLALLHYWNGSTRGLTLTNEDALAWCEAAAAQGHLGAHHLLISVYSGGGLGVSPDKSKSVEYLAKAAKLGDAKAQSTYGALLARGEIGAKPDFEKAVELFKLAAAQGNIPGINKATITPQSGMLIELQTKQFAVTTVPQPSPFKVSKVVVTGLWQLLLQQCGDDPSMQAPGVQLRTLPQLASSPSRA